MPSARPHYASGLPPAAFEAVVASYLRHGLAGTQPKVGGWGWDELQELNAGVDWAAWEREVLPGVLAGSGGGAAAAPVAAAAEAAVAAAAPAPLPAAVDIPVHPSVAADS